VGLSKRMTFYYSLEDVPLLVSSLLHPSEPRAGRSQIFLTGMDTICADGDNAHYLFNWGHTYFAEAPLLISDLSGVVVGQREVSQRVPPLFKQSTTSTPASVFWIFDSKARRGS
jgi:hypothetical protein